MTQLIQHSGRPSLTAVVGAQGSGKTYFLEEKMSHGHRSVFVYRPGTDNWQTYLSIELIVEDNELHFLCEGELYHFFEDRAFFKGKRIKCLGNQEAESYLWKLLDESSNAPFSGWSFIIDDTTGVFNRMTNSQKRLFSRTKHVEIDFYFLLHGYSFIPTNMWDMITDLTLFTTNTPPPDKVKRISRVAHELLTGIQKLLRQGEEYSYALFKMSNNQWSIHGPNNSTFTPVQKQHIHMSEQMQAAIKMLAPLSEPILNSLLKKHKKAIENYYGVPAKELMLTLYFKEGAAQQYTRIRVSHKKEVKLDEKKTPKEISDIILPMIRSREFSDEVFPSEAKTMFAFMPGLSLPNFLEGVSDEIFESTFKGDLFISNRIYVKVVNEKIIFGVPKSTGKGMKQIQFNDLWNV